MSRNSPRQPRAHTTREAILNAARELAIEAGARGVTTRRLAQRAGLSVGSVYRYFADRQSVLIELLDRQHGEVIERWFRSLGDLSSAPADMAAARLLEHYLEAVERVPGYVDVLRAVREIRPMETVLLDGAEADGGHRAYAACLGIATDAARLKRIRMLKVVTQTLMELLLLAPEHDKPAVAAELVAYAASAIERLRQT